MSLNTRQAKRPALRVLEKDESRSAQQQWFAILPNAGRAYDENARSFERFVLSLQRYFHNDQIISTVDTTHVNRLSDRVYWNRLGRFIVEPYHISTALSGILALDFVLRVNPEAWIAVLPNTPSLGRLRDTWYLYHKLKQESQDADGDVVVVRGAAKKLFGAQRPARNDVSFEIASRPTHEQMWGPEALMAGGKAEAVWAFAEKSMPELTRRITEELRPTIRAVEAGRVDAKHVFFCLMHLYEAMEAEAETATRQTAPQLWPLLTEN